MPGIRQFWNIGYALLVVTAMVATFSVVYACPYCPPTDETLSEKLAAASDACVVKYVETKRGQELSQEETTFLVATALRTGQSIKKGDKVVVPFGVTADAGDLFLIMGQKVGGEREWSLPVRVDELGTEVEYVKKAPAPESLPAPERLKYFLKYINSKNSLISNDAFGEFARAKFEDVAELAPSISRQDVRKWIEDPDPSQDPRRAFYSMLLGLCGNEEDADYMERKILAPIDPGKNRFWIDGMMGGYLMLRGERGLKLLLDKKLDSLPADISESDPRTEDVNALRVTLVFLWDYRRTQFPEETLRSAMRRCLKRPELAELVVIDLARWKDWDSLDTLISGYGQDPWESRAAKEKIVAFALSCRKHTEKSRDEKSLVYAQKAQKFLDSLDPEFVQSVKRSSGGPLARPEPTAKSAQRPGGAE
ncbi:hypothetical protein [Schlesneria paludicola]|uniref:hypothetical protein n=1 Tax=Schlesneria paludicola TaxID=360056 RepID=UPI000299E6F6|nr:hypothetical protein [Schlesneria paludicola]